MRYPVPALWRCRVVEVHDGDTIIVDVDRGIEETSRWHVRLKDVWAPELRDAGGQECRTFAMAWVVQHGDGSDWPLVLETFRTPRSDDELMTLGRYLGVLRDAGGSSLNLAMQGFVLEHGYGPGVT